MNATRPTRALVVGACAIAVALPASAGALTAPVTVGGFVASTRADLQAFYPGITEVRAGDSVRFTIRGVHSVAFLRKGTKRPALIVAGRGRDPVVTDAAGRRLWWSAATPAQVVNPAALTATRGRSFDGRATVASGTPRGATAAFTVRFPTVGLYQAVCLVHPRMKATVRVRRSSARQPPLAAAARRAAIERARDVAAAARLSRQMSARRPTSTTVVVGPGTARFTLHTFFPSRLTTRAGTRLTFKTGGRNDLHTVTFGPAATLTTLGRGLVRGRRAPAPLNPLAALPSDPPASQPVTLTGATHGNGFQSSGLLSPVGQPGRRVFQVVIGAQQPYDPGVITFSSLAQAGMTGRITVTN